jgi:dipeptidase D
MTRPRILAALASAALVAGVSIGTALADDELAGDARPLVEVAAEMDPADVWQAFADLTQVPRPSHHEEQATQALAAYGEGLGLETIVDGLGNVIIRRPAAAGLEDRPGVVLQAHMDMVPQVVPGKEFDFETDAIEAYVVGEWVTADGTTLGADDGIGLALAMAALADPTPLGPIEALFTTNEEDGMSGALGLSPDVLQGEFLINLDSETEGQFTIGSAGGEYADAMATFPMTPVTADSVAYTIAVEGLQGGHSGVDIGRGRGHATKLLVRLLQTLLEDHDIGLATLAGGTAANAIPSRAEALIVVPAAEAAALEAEVVSFEAVVQNELALADPGVTIAATPADPPAAVLEDASMRLVLDALHATPQGVLRMSDGVPGLVETSTNMGIVELADGQLAVTSLMRSSVDSELADVHQMTASVWDLAGLETAFSGWYGGWQPDPASPILALMTGVYEEVFGHAPEVGAIHAGLEAGAIKALYPAMDAISIGPTLEGVHTVDERLRIDTVPMLDDLLMGTLQRIADEGSVAMSDG